MKWINRLLRFARWHRGLIAGVLAALATLLAIQQFLPDAGVGVEVVLTKRRLAAGVNVTSEDLILVRVPTKFVPETAVSDLSVAIGKTTAIAVSERQILTTTHLISGRVAGHSGAAVVPVAVDEQLRPLLRVGGRVDLIGHTVSKTGDPVILAENALIVGLPEVAAGRFGPSAQRTMLVEVPTGTAATIAQLSIGGRIGVAVR